MKEKKHRVKNMFDSIAHRYDFLNHLLSFGFDYYWRRRALKLTEFDDSAILLDIACGTGDFAIEARKQGVKKIFGADLSKNMLHRFNAKKEWINGNLIQFVAEEMPLKDETVTNITVAFGIRNFYDIQKGFQSFFRVLAKNGKATILEFQMPDNDIFKQLYKFYFKKILPAVGGFFSGSKEAYNYLPNSVEEFDEKISMPEMLFKAGFSEIIYYSLTLGIVQVLIAKK
jgi:demethylmenaquinone methyltransferase/2-methoxy-6-polyprenyl-1,4-benzoquinol methylase